MIDQDKLRIKAKAKVITKKMMAAHCNTEYTFFTKWWNGLNVSEDVANRIKEGLKQLK